MLNMAPQVFFLGWGPRGNALHWAQPLLKPALHWGGMGEMSISSQSWCTQHHSPYPMTDWLLPPLFLLLFFPCFKKNEGNRGEGSRRRRSRRPGAFTMPVWWAGPAFEVPPIIFFPQLKNWIAGQSYIHKVSRKNLFSFKETNQKGL